MNLTAFIDVDTRNPQSFREFLDLNAYAHQTTHNALLEQGVTVEQYPMFTESADENWKEVHYAEHVAWNAALGVDTPPDLITVDLQDPQQAEDWLTNHEQLHQLVNEALGL